MKFSNILLFLSLGYFQESMALSLQDALHKKWISVESKWKNKAPEETSSLRHGKNLWLKLNNLSAQTLQIDVPPGTMLTAEDQSKQNMLLTEALQFNLKPKESSSKFCRAYCCEATDAAPADNENYLLKAPANEKLQQLAQFVNQKNFEGYGVQRAIWCLSNKNNLSDINAEDSAQTRELIYFTGNLEGYKPEEILKCYQKTLNGGKEFERLLALEIPVNSDETEVWIVIENVNNNKLQTVLKKTKPGKGIFKKQFGVSSIDLGYGDFVVRVYSTDRPVSRTSFSLRS